MSNWFMRRLVLFILTLLTITQTITIVHAEEEVPSSTLGSVNFWQLNKAITLYQNASQHSWPTIPDSPSLLKIGMRSYAVLLLRERLILTGDLDPTNDIGGKRFDLQLSDAVKIFQTRHGLKADGSVGGETRMELNVPPDKRAKQIAINMQRWADIAGKLGDRFIIVNIPDFHMYLYDHNQKMLSLRAIVGKPELQTPEIMSKITRIVFNPYWNIPNTIAKKDIAPKMIENPGYANHMHIRVLTSEDDDAGQINPYHINWEAAAQGNFNYHLRQDPGPDNALGLVKFEFQNSHDVYMHDTSAKDLFNTDNRGYSHGCIRLENPFSLAEYLLKDDSRWNEQRIQEIIEAGNTKYVKVPQPIPIFIVYITAWVDDEGRVNFRDDLYQMDGENTELGQNQTEPVPHEIVNDY